MKVIEVSRHGGPDVLQLVEKPTPIPEAGQVLIEVKAAGINFADLMSREGSYPMAPAPPFVPGFEAAGVVAAVGSGVTSVAVGTRVAALLPKPSGYAQYAIAEAVQTVPLPDTLDFAPATALLVQGLTALFLLDFAAKMTPGQSVLVSAAAGGVGSLAVQIAKQRGAGTVIGLASSTQKRDLVQSLGADAAIDYTQRGWGDRVREATNGAGTDIFLDATGDISQDTFTALAQNGKWILYGLQKRDALLSGDLLGRLIFGNQALIGFSIYGVPQERMQPALGELLQWTASGKLKIIASESFPLNEAASAHQAIADRKTTGKVVLVP